MMTWKFRDDVTNGLGVTVLTDKLTNRRYTENNTILSARMIKVHLQLQQCY